jgi:myosin heavy subunit
MHRYIILAPNAMKAEKEEKKCAQACFDAIELDADKYRLGHTKARPLNQLDQILRRFEFPRPRIALLSNHTHKLQPNPIKLTHSLGFFSLPF